MTVPAERRKAAGCTATLLVLLLLSACNTGPGSATRLDSDDFAARETRVEQLAGAVKLPSAIADAEFELFNVNGFPNHRISVPGASSRDYKMAVRVDPGHLSAWTAGMTESDPGKMADDWTQEIVRHRKEQWGTHSRPRYFTGRGAELLVFAREGILFKRIANL